MGFEPTRAEHNGLAVHRLNHSATSSAETQANAEEILKQLVNAHPPFPCGQKCILPEGGSGDEVWSNGVRYSG